MTQLFANSSVDSSCSLLESDWPDAFEQNYSIIPADSFSLENELYFGRSLCDDIKRIESGGTDFPGSENSDIDDVFSPPEVRNYNCMWSGEKCSSLNALYSLSPTDSSITAVPPADIIGNSHKISENVIKTEPVDSETDSQQRTLPRHIPQQQQQATNQQSMQKIAPGTSLLLNSRKVNQQQQPQQQQQQQQSQHQQQQIHKKSKCSISNSIQIPLVQTSEFLRDRELITSSPSPTFVRPETPHSSDDDATEFKHSYDLRACVMGSNNISLIEGIDPDKMLAINRLREHLEDTNKKIVPNHMGSLADVMSVIEKDNISLTDRRSKDEDDGYFSQQQYSYSNYSSTSNQQNSTGDWDSSSDDASSVDGDATSLLSKRSDCSLSMSVSSNQMGSSSNIYPVKHSDHSYTRSKDGINDISPNLETPSDSDEEIDVVSIGDKKLPTNPSDKDRRALQTKVAHKFSSARIVKTANGIRTIPPRRRVSYDLPHTPASLSPVKTGSSLANSRYPSPPSTPYSSSQYSSSSSSTSSSKYHHHHHHHHHHHGSQSKKRIGSNCSIRTGGGVYINGSNSDEYIPPSKRHRGKKQKNLHSSASIKRHYSVDEVDTIEKRNLHNDMERQRRIGLKNLFEALKKQIPSIKDKERAPKVNILREAAKLCENLTREEQLLSDQKEMLRDQLRKRQEILNQLRIKQNALRRC